MNTFSKVLALAFFGASTALISSTSPSQAQTERQAYQAIDPSHPASECCIPAQRPVNTNATSGWTVKPPTGPTIPAVAVSSTPYWHAAFPGSQWIANTSNAGSTWGPAPGKYTYTYHFCLCALPPKVTGAFPAALYLSVLSDNGFSAYLNNNPIGSNYLGNSFTVPKIIPSASANFFQAGDNTLTFVVTNQLNANTPTGLDVSGWISGYFQQPCHHGPTSE